MSTSTRVAAAVTLLLAGAACAHAPSTAPSAPGERLVVENFGGGLAVVGSDGQGLQMLDAGVLAPDAKRLYQRIGDQFVVRDLSGTELARTTVATGLTFPYVNRSDQGGLSQDGSHVALVLYEREVDRITNSHFAVYDTRNLSAAPRRADLAGDFEYDALSNDGRLLFLLEYQHAGDRIYQVRSYDLSAGRLVPGIIVDKSKIGEIMAGERLAGIATQNGSTLYSLYAERGGAFIHALPLTANQPFALCIDLPDKSSLAADHDAWSIAMDAPGSHIYAVNPNLRVVAAVDTSTGRIGPTLQLSRPASSSRFVATVQAKEPVSGPAGSVLTSSGRLYFPAYGGIAVVDVHTMKQLPPVASGLSVTALALSPDGSRLWALTSRDTVIRLDAADGRQLAETPLSGSPHRLLAVLPAA